ncbi:hypothetical protein PVK06_010921 [Gossypium arboreum]|uniref:Defective in cullin neddylation protein n=1 Tax=Gossypium arboreum TaxID=29729 RepID=A0ABR0Q834_GOSAR|nr:hypothetical protein PVK06_010921 [Gossypium arboreum]
MDNVGNDGGRYVQWFLQLHHVLAVAVEHFPDQSRIEIVPSPSNKHFLVESTLVISDAPQQIGIELEHHFPSKKLHKADKAKLRTGYGHVCGGEGYREDEESQRAKFTREALNHLLKMESRMRARHVNATFDELLKLKLQLHFMVDFSEFSRFYDFVLFVCRENGQKNITVSRAVAAWRLVLAGRFRLLNQWCDFVEKNQRHNISEDTWQQVLAFTRFVHETLEGYDPEGINRIMFFFMHMMSCRISGSNKDTNLFCSYGDSRFQSYAYDDSLPDPMTGQIIFPRIHVVKAWKLLNNVVWWVLPSLLVKLKVACQRALRGCYRVARILQFDWERRVLL